MGYNDNRVLLATLVDVDDCVGLGLSLEEMTSLVLFHYLFATTVEDEDMFLNLLT